MPTGMVSASCQGPDFPLRLLLWESGIIYSKCPLHPIVVGVVKREPEANHNNEEKPVPWE